MNDYKVLYLKDMKDEHVEALLSKISDENAALYDCIYENLSKESSFGIKEDILEYICEHISEFRKDQEYAFQITSLMLNVKFSVEHLIWVNQYLNNDGKIELEDFMVIFEAALERDVPLEKIKELFTNETDDVEIYGVIMSYDGRSISEAVNSDETPEKQDTSESDPAEISTTNSYNQEEVVDNSLTQSQMAVTEMFDNLLTAMSYRDKEANESVLKVQDELNKIIAKFQLAATELATYSTVIIRDWEKDKEEIRRLKALHEIQQKLLSSQQYKINELRNEIISLQDRISVAKKSELQRDAIKRTVTDLENLVNSLTTSDPLLENH